MLVENTNGVNRSPNRFFVGYLAVLLMACAFGCDSQDATPKTSLFEDDHAVAEHWPSDLSDVAVKLRERLSSPEINAQVMKEIEDLISWTAEVAADTNLSETDWLPLHHASQSLMANLRGVRDGLNESDRSQIESLCQLIDQSVSKIPEQLASLKVTS